ncbi:MAG: hypothetical protein CVU36_17355 [Betaproteobacteria bacterium HGW-Betaproteobacteria-9]|nr:MAG: hypothetical protein CVU36_17355 [Betaproteobacteria bacterium HGW-Betaproteobacteria-9]
MLTPLAASTQTASSATPTEPFQTIEQLDVGYYQGTWYEMTKHPNRFQRHRRTVVAAQEFTCWIAFFDGNR